IIRAGVHARLLSRRASVASAGEAAKGGALPPALAQRLGARGLEETGRGACGDIVDSDPVAILPRIRIAHARREGDRRIVADSPLDGPGTADIVADPDDPVDGADPEGAGVTGRKREGSGTDNRAATAARRAGCTTRKSCS